MCPRGWPRPRLCRETADDVPMNFRSLAALGTAAVWLLPLASSASDPPVALRYKFVAGQTLRYLVMRDPYFNDPARAVETADPRAPFRPPVVERLTERVQSVGADGTATVAVTLGPEPGFEDPDAPQPAVTRTAVVTREGRVLSPRFEPALTDLLRAFFRLPAAPIRVGASWQGTAPRGSEMVGATSVLSAESRPVLGLAVIERALPPLVTQGRSPDHDGTLLQTTRGTQTDRIVFDTRTGSLRRQTSVLTVTLSLVMTGRGARGSADFGHVVPNVQVVQTLTIERKDDAPGSP